MATIVNDILEYIFLRDIQTNQENLTLTMLTRKILLKGNIIFIFTPHLAQFFFSIFTPYLPQFHDFLKNIFSTVTYEKVYMS